MKFEFFTVTFFEPMKIQQFHAGGHGARYGVKQDDTII